MSKPNNLFLKGILGSSIFLVAGVVIFYIGYLRPTMRSSEAKSWDKTPCVITSSKTFSQKSTRRGRRGISRGTSTSYKPKISFRYTYAEKTYNSDNFTFDNTASGDYDKVNAFSLSYPVGRETECYVNPANPTEAVVHLGLLGSTSFVLYVPLIFVIVCIGSIVYFVVKKKQESDSEEE